MQVWARLWAVLRSAVTPQAAPSGPAASQSHTITSSPACDEAAWQQSTGARQEPEELAVRALRLRTANSPAGVTFVAPQARHGRDCRQALRRYLFAGRR